MTTRVASNDLGPAKTDAPLLRCDSVHGRVSATATVTADAIDAGPGPSPRPAAPSRLTSPLPA